MTSKTVHHQPVPTPEKGPNDALLPVQPAEAAAPDISPVEAPVFPEAPTLEGHAHSPNTAPGTTEIKAPERNGFWTRRKAIALGAGFAVLASIGVIYGVSRSASAESVATPAASGPAVPGNTSRQPSTTTTTNSPEASANTSTATKPATSSSAEATKYVRKNSLLQVSADEAFEQWGVPSAAKISTLVKSASTPEAAIDAVRAADKDDFENYVESFTYGAQGQKLNDFIDKIYSQNPKAFPDSLLKSFNMVGPGKEKLTNPQDIVNDFNVRLVIASMVAQDETLSKTDRMKMTAVIMASLTAPNMTISPEDFKPTPNGVNSDVSRLFMGDYIYQLDNMIDQPVLTPRLVTLLELDTEAQAQLVNPKFTANMINVAGGTVPVEGIGLVTRVYGDTSSKQSEVSTIVNVKTGSYTFETSALSEKVLNIGPDYGKWVSTRTVSKTNSTPIFTNFKTVQ